MKSGRHNRATGDRAIRAAIEAALSARPGFECADFQAVHVTVRGGGVELRGNVRTGPARIEAEQLVRAVRGVRDVHNWLVADDALARQVERSVLHVLRTGIDGLRVECLFGRVELHGAARSQLQRATAMLAARRVTGVVDVSSSLTAGEHLATA